MVDCGHGAALFLRFHHHQRRGQRRNEPVALQKAIGANGAALGRVLADHAAFLLDLFPQLPVGGRVGAVNGHAQHPDGGAVFLHCGPVPGAVQPIGQTADDDGPVFGQPAAQICRRLQAAARVGGRQLDEVELVPGARFLLLQQGRCAFQLLHDAGIGPAGIIFHAVALHPAPQHRVRAAHRNVKDHIRSSFLSAQRLIFAP